MMSVRGQFRGVEIQGIWISPTRFMGSSCLNALEWYGLKRPSRLEQAPNAEMKDQKFKAAVTLRRDVQRRFDAARRKRAQLYARYLEGLMVHKRKGSAPAITIWTEFAEVDEDAGVLYFKHDSPLVAIDGETQLEARYILRDDPDFGRKETGDYHFPIDIHHDVPEDFARQVLHDYNFYAHPVTERQAITQNVESPITQAVHQILEGADVDKSLISRFKQTPAGKEVISVSQVMCALIGCIMKETAISSSALSFVGKSKGRLVHHDGEVTDNGHIAVSQLDRDLITELVRFSKDKRDATKASIETWTAAGILAATHPDRHPSSYQWAAVREAIKNPADGRRITGAKARQLALNTL